MELCGSLRRRKETIADIDILASSDGARGRSWTARHAAFGVKAGPRQGSRHKRRPSSRKHPPANDVHHERRPARRAGSCTSPFSLHYFIGRQAAYIRMRAVPQGSRPEAERVRTSRAAPAFPRLQDGSRPLPMPSTSEDIPPELREDTGEMEASPIEKHAFAESWSNWTTCRASSTTTL